MSRTSSDPHGQPTTHHGVEPGTGDQKRLSKGVSAGISDRVLSLDQFRGYTILGMILVNFIGYFDEIHLVFRHNDNYFSFADSIMPAFHLAVGFSYRLTMLRRLALANASLWSVWWSYLKRSLTLVFIGVLFFGIGGGFRSWSQFSEMPSVPGTASAPLESKTESSESESSSLEQSAPTPPFSETFAAQWRHWLAGTLKSHMWNTLAIIGVTQIVILPFVASSFRTRILAMFGFALGHALLTNWFNWGFVVGDPNNWMVQLWGTGSMSSWDGGFFGPLSWAMVMLAGTLAYDIVSANSARQAASKLLLSGAALMLVAWGLSCVSRLYDLDKGAIPSKQRPQNAFSPMYPTLVDLSDASLASLLAEPPFVAPPGTSDNPVRLRNYWMMIKQIPTLTFMMCATGFAMLVYGLFVWLCDVKGWWLGLLNTFGTNALAAYVLHNFIVDQINKLVPTDSPVWYVMLGFLVFFLSTWSVVRYLEKRNLFIRL